MTAGGSSASKGPHEPDGELTDDTASAAELRLTEGASDDEQPSSSYLEPAAGEGSPPRPVASPTRAPSLCTDASAARAALCTRHHTPAVQLAQPLGFDHAIQRSTGLAGSSRMECRTLVVDYLCTTPAACTLRSHRSALLTLVS